MPKHFWVFRVQKEQKFGNFWQMWSNFGLKRSFSVCNKLLHLGILRLERYSVASYDRLTFRYHKYSSPLFQNYQVSNIYHSNIILPLSSRGPDTLLVLYSDLHVPRERQNMNPPTQQSYTSCYQTY